MWMVSILLAIFLQFLFYLIRSGFRLEYNSFGLIWHEPNIQSVRLCSLNSDVELTNWIHPVAVTIGEQLKERGTGTLLRKYVLFYTSFYGSSQQCVWNGRLEKESTRLRGNRNCIPEKLIIFLIIFCRITFCYPVAYYGYCRYYHKYYCYYF